MRRLVEALNVCWLPHAASPGPAGAAATGSAPGAAAIDLADFKRDIRERQVWCSSCMIAFEGAESIGVLIGAKRATETLIDRIAVRPDRMRLGHGRHMLDSLGAKLAILGPKRMVAEIPEDRPDAAAFFAACGFVPEARLTDWVLEDGGRLRAESAGEQAATRRPAGIVPAPARAGETLILPVSVADLAANRLLTDNPASSWDRAAATQLARAGIVQGLALASIDRIHAFALYRPDTAGRPGVLIDVLGPDHARPGEDETARRTSWARLLVLILERAGGPIRIPRLTEDEVPSEWLRVWGFRPDTVWRRHAAAARCG